MCFLEQFINECSTAENISDLQNHWTEFIYQFGVEGYRIVPFTPDVQAQSGLLCDIAHKTPDGWIDHYRDQRLHRWDPVLAKEIVDRGPFTWKDATEEFCSQEARQVTAEAKNFGVYDGVSMSMWLEPGTLIAVGLYMPSEKIFLDDITKRIMRTAAFVFCECYREMAAELKPINEPPPRLSPRECDVIRWIALGKTKQEIADIMQVSTSCIKRHCEKISIKLNVNNMASAVAQAMSYGFLSL